LRDFPQSWLYIDIAENREKLDFLEKNKKSDLLIF